MSSFTDKLVNSVMPDEQISGLLTYEDQISESEKQVIAEKVGRSLSGKSGSNGTDGASLDKFQDSTYAAFVEGDAQRWLRITGSANGNDGFYHVESVDSSSEITISPALSASETGLSWQLYREPNLQDDVNLAITQLREAIDPSSDWFQNMPRGFDPADTDGSDTKNEKMSIRSLADNWYGVHTKILRNLLFEGQSVADSDTGKLLTTTKAYATPSNRTGGSSGALVVHESIANSGSYQDEGEINAKTKVNIIDEQTGDELLDANGDVIFGKLEDGADHSGTGDGTDVFVQFFVDDGTNSGLGSEYTWALGSKTVRFELPVRKRRRDLLEHEESSKFSGSTLGDAETAQDISQIRDALGIADGDGSGDWDLTNTSASYPFSELTVGSATVEDIVNKLNEEIGSRLYAENNVLVDGETITESLDRLDKQLSLSIKSKIVERVSSTISRGTAHTIPFASGTDTSITSYRQDTSNHAGLYMDVMVAGRKLIPDSSASAADGEYEETSNTEVTFRFNVRAGQVIEYLIRDDA